MRISDWSSDVCSSDLDGADDFSFAAVVAVEDGLAVFDALGQAAGGDCVPALLLRQFAGRRHDETFAVRPLPLLAVLYRHAQTLAALDRRAGGVLASPQCLAALEIGRASCRERVCQYV